MFRNIKLLIIATCCLINGIQSTLNRGMTWGVQSIDLLNGVTEIGCSGSSCNAYVGDTSCDKILPILCFSDTNFTRPPYGPFTPCSSCAMTVEFYHGWSGGVFRETQPIIGKKLISISNMDKICQEQFGSFFRSAFHHMGKYVVGMNNNTFFYSTWPASVQNGGWAANGYGIFNVGKRFWVYISGQPANCWNP